MPPAEAADSLQSLLFKYLHAGVVVHAADTTIIEANEEAARLLGLTTSQLLGRDAMDPSWDFFDQHGSPLPLASYPVQRVLASGQPVCDMIVGVSLPGENGLCWLLANAFPDTGVTGQLARVVVTFIDITHRRLAEMRQLRLTEVLRAIRNVNQLITQEKDPARLLHGACHLLTERQGYRSAWIVLEDDKGNLQLAGEAKTDSAFAGIRQEIAAGRWPHCCREAMAAPGLVVIDTAASCCVGCCLAGCYQQSAAFAGALRHSGRSFGTMVVAVPAEMADDTEEQSLFREIASDISLALRSIELDQQRNQAVAAQSESEGQFRAMFELAAVGMAQVGLDGRWLRVNQRLSSITGYSEEELLTKNFQQISHPDDLQAEYQFAEGLLTSESGSGVFEKRYIHKNGQSVPVRINVSLVRGHNGAPRYFLAIIEDISQQQEAQRLLAQSEERYRLVSENSSDVIWLLDLATSRFTYVSPSVEKLRGYTAAEVQQQSLAEVLTADSYEMVRRELPSRLAAFAAGDQSRRSFTNEISQRCRDGREVLTEVVSTIVADSEGQPRYLQGVSRDITARRRVEQQVARNQRIFELFITYAPAAIAMFDQQMRYLAVSRRFLSDYGISEREVIGHSHYEIFPEIPERWHDIHRRCLQGATERCLEDPFPRADGSLDWIRWEIRPWHELSGEIGGIILFSEVITEQKQLLLELAASEEKFRDLFQRHAAVKLVIDPESAVIVDANQAAARFYGWPVERLRQMRISDINVLTKEETAREMAIAAAGKRIYFEFRHRLADGSVKDVAVYSSRIESKGKALLYSIIHDISASKEAEEERERLRRQLEQAQKLESVGQLAGGVAHDFNNMLGVIMGYSELAMDKTGSDHPLYADLREIYNAASRSADITRQLLAFARKQTIAPRVLDLNAAISGVLKMIRRLIGEDIDLAWIPGHGLWPVLVDPSQIDQIMANLCVNARDAINGVGKVTIETANVSVDQQYCQEHYGIMPGDYVLLAVSDDGCGMDKELVQHIFEPFYTTKGLGQGTGMGLATVYGIVKQNHGLINVYSEPGKGTTIRIYLPRTARAEAHHREQAAAVCRGAGETVLLVEDEKEIRNMTQRMLALLGYQVLVADSVAAALQLAQKQPGSIDLLLTDVVMPEMNGRELAARLTELAPQLKVLFMSGYTANVIAHRGVLDDGVHFLQKPFSLQEMAVKVHQALYQAG